MKIKKLVLFLILVVLIIMFGIFAFLLKTNDSGDKIKDYVYAIEYYENYDSESYYLIYFLKDNKIKVLSQSGEIKNISFSNENMNSIWEWVKEGFKDNENKKIKLYSTDIDDGNYNDKMIIYSLIYDNEKYLNFSEDEDYEVLNFTNYEIVNNDLELINGEKFIISSQDDIVFVNGEETNIVNGQFYAVDIDNDDVKEIIVSKMDDKMDELLVSPPTTKYYIYKYFKDNNRIEEIVAMNVVGKIDSFYVNGPVIKISYHPYGGKENYNEEKYYKFLSEDYEIKISPVYLNQPSNNLILYKNNFLITKTYSDNGIKDMINYIDIHKMDINNIKEEIINEASSESNKNCVPFYMVEFKNDSNKYYLCDGSTIIEDIIIGLNYNDKIWYVN